MKIKVLFNHLMVKEIVEIITFFFCFPAGKSLDAFNVSGENNFQRSMIVQSSTLFNNEENEMSSADWLKIYGMDAQKLDFFSVLQSAAFRHCDGVVTILKPPNGSLEVTAETPAVISSLLKISIAK